MKKITCTLIIGLISSTSFAQTNWQKGGNSNFSSPPGLPATIGTDVTWNSPLGFLTNGVQRMQLNGNNLTVPTTAAAGTQNTSGFLGINTNNPWSRVHIATPGSTLYGGCRGWMREGLTLQENNDQLWFGHKKWGANPDQFMQSLIGAMTKV